MVGYVDIVRDENCTTVATGSFEEGKEPKYIAILRSIVNLENTIRQLEKLRDKIDGREIQTTKEKCEPEKPPQTLYDVLISTPKSIENISDRIENVIDEIEELIF